MMRQFISQMDPNGQFIIWWIHCFFLGGAHLKPIPVGLKHYGRSCVCVPLTTIPKSEVGSIRVPGAQNVPSKVTVNSLIAGWFHRCSPHKNCDNDWRHLTIGQDSNQSWNDMWTTDYWAFSLNASKSSQIKPGWNPFADVAVWFWCVQPFLAKEPTNGHLQRGKKFRWNKSCVGGHLVLVLLPKLWQHEKKYIYIFNLNMHKTYMHYILDTPWYSCQVICYTDTRIKRSNINLEEWFNNVWEIMSQHVHSAWCQSNWVLEINSFPPLWHNFIHVPRLAPWFTTRPQWFLQASGRQWDQAGAEGGLCGLLDLLWESSGALRGNGSLHAYFALCSVQVHGWTGHVDQWQLVQIAHLEAWNCWKIWRWFFGDFHIDLSGLSTLGNL